MCRPIPLPPNPAIHVSFTTPLSARVYGKSSLQNQAIGLHPQALLPFSVRPECDSPNYEPSSSPRGETMKALCLHYIYIYIYARPRKGSAVFENAVKEIVVATCCMKVLFALRPTLLLRRSWKDLQCQCPSSWLSVAARTYPSRHFDDSRPYANAWYITIAGSPFCTICVPTEGK